MALASRAFLAARSSTKRVGTDMARKKDDSTTGAAQDLHQDDWDFMISDNESDTLCTGVRSACGT